MCLGPRPPYPEEFRREAIEFAPSSSKSQRRIAEDLGISDVTLRNWIKQAERDEGKRPDCLSTDEVRRAGLLRTAIASIVGPMARRREERRGHLGSGSAFSRFSAERRALGRGWLAASKSGVGRLWDRLADWPAAPPYSGSGRT